MSRDSSIQDYDTEFLLNGLQPGIPPRGLCFGIPTTRYTDWDSFIQDFNLGFFLKASQLRIPSKQITSWDSSLPNYYRDSSLLDYSRDSSFPDYDLGICLP